MAYLIIYPSGSHGNFLSAALNTLVGVPAGNLGHLTYDNTTYSQPRKFVSAHLPEQLSNYADSVDGLIHISVNTNSYLKYSAVCFNRTSSNDLILEDFEHDTFKKLETHAIFKSFVKSLTTISGQISGDVCRASLREWARLCFFANNGKTISQWLDGTRIANPDYTFDYEWFYDEHNFKEQCYKLLAYFNLPVVGDIDSMLPLFYQNNRYRLIDTETELIISAIKNRNNYDIPNINFFQEAYIDNWLVDTYNIDPLYIDKYYSNTQDLIKQYNI